MFIVNAVCINVDLLNLLFSWSKVKNHKVQSLFIRISPCFIILKQCSSTLVIFTATSVHAAQAHLLTPPSMLSCSSSCMLLSSPAEWIRATVLYWILGCWVRCLLSPQLLKWILVNMTLDVSGKGWVGKGSGSFV